MLFLLLRREKEREKGYQESTETEPKNHFLGKPKKNKKKKNKKKKKKKTLTPQHNIFPPRNPITTIELGIGVEDLMNEEEEEEEIILHLCHDRKQATHKTKNSKSVVSSFQSPFPSTSFPFLSFFPCLQRNPRNPNSPHSSCELF